MRIKETITNLEALTILPDNTIGIARRTVWRICKQYGEYVNSMETVSTVWTVWRICKQYGDSIDSMDGMENM